MVFVIVCAVVFVVVCVVVIFVDVFVFVLVIVFVFVNEIFVFVGDYKIEFECAVADHQSFAYFSVALDVCSVRRT